MCDEPFPATIQDFNRRFCDEDSCVDYLRKKKYPNGFSCKKCAHDKAYFIRSRRSLECAKCGGQVAVTSGTIFEQTKKPLLLIFHAIFQMTTSKRGISASEMKRLLGTKSDQTTWAWLHKLRIATVRPDRAPLSGENEVDESYVGGRKKGKRGRGAKGKAVVVCAAEKRGAKGMGRIRLDVVEDASGDSLKAFIEKNMTPGATALTDGWDGYRGLDKSAYKHIVSIIKGSGKTASEIFPLVHKVFKLLKDWISGTFHGSISKKHLDAYLNEFVFRFNRRTVKRVTHCFEKLVEIAVVTSHVPYWKIIGRIAPDTPLCKKP